MISKIISEREVRLIDSVVNPKYKNSNLGARRLIKQPYLSGIKRYAIYHKDIDTYLDKDGNSYKREDLL